jgi:cobalamin-dependent methionine synthase I
MSIRIQNASRQVLKTSTATATISRGMSDAILIGNKIITVQKNGNEIRTHYADSTLRELADSIYDMLKSKGFRKTRKKETKPRTKPLTLAQRLAAMDETRNRKLALAS